MGLGERYKRWRHTRGYGVHSPFAYRMVTEVIQDPKGYAYYGFENIDPGRRRKEKRFLRSLLRLAAINDVGSAYLAKSRQNEPLKQVLLAANPEMKIIPEKAFVNDARLIILSGEELALEQLEELLDRPGRMLLLRDYPRDWADVLFNALDEGLVLEAPRTLIVISRYGMQKVRYSICDL